MEQQFATTGKLPQFVIQEIRNNCSNSETQTPIAQSQQEYFDYEEQRKFSAMERQAAIERTNMMSAAQAKIMADQPRLMSEAVQSALKYSSETAGVGFRNFEHPCDYPNQP